MKIRELIKALKQFDPEDDVFVGDIGRIEEIVAVSPNGGAQLTTAALSRKIMHEFDLAQRSEDAFDHQPKRLGHAIHQLQDKTAGELKIMLDRLMLLRPKKMCPGGWAQIVFAHVLATLQVALEGHPPEDRLRVEQNAALEAYCQRAYFARVEADAQVDAAKAARREAKKARRRGRGRDRASPEAGAPKPVVAPDPAAN